MVLIISTTTRNDCCRYLYDDADQLEIDTINFSGPVLQIVYPAELSGLLYEHDAV
jgi:hypothetical protein